MEDVGFVVCFVGFDELIVGFWLCFKMLLFLFLGFLFGDVVKVYFDVVCVVFDGMM